MSLVGPRPIPMALEDRLIAEIPGFSRRWEVLPGLTNAAQVSIVDNKLGDDLVADDVETHVAGTARLIRRVILDGVDAHGRLAGGSAVNQNSFSIDITASTRGK